LSEEHTVESIELTDQQSLRIAHLPGDYRVVGIDRHGPYVRKPSGQIMRIRRDGRLDDASREANRRLADRGGDGAYRYGKVSATTPYTSVMD